MPNIKDIPLSRWLSGQLKAEVASLLDTPRYVLMSELERHGYGYPASDESRREFIVKHYEAAADGRASPTPGPWAYNDGYEIVQAAQPHLRVAFLPSNHLNIADGHLIAAAPEMLAALRAIAAVVPNLGNAGELVNRLELARTVIAKVEGRKP